MIVGHELIREMMQKSFVDNRLPHAMLFWGSKGIGKYTLALSLIRLINCLHPQNAEPCGSCVNCQRIALPFPFHPDVKILRDISTPLYLYRQEVFRRFQSDHQNPGKELSDDFKNEYTEGLKLLLDQGYLTKVMSCNAAKPPLDIIRFDREKRISASLIEKNANRPMLCWLLKKLNIYQESVCFDRNIKIDSIRDVQKMLYLHSFEGKYKAVVIDGADRMLPPAQNCLLKILEEPPGDSILILIVDNPAGLLPTIRSRCQLIPFYKLSPLILAQGLTSQFGFDEKTATAYSENAQGSFSSALGSDWEKESYYWSVCERIFDSGTDEDINWVLNTSREVIAMDESGGTNGLIRVYRWLHDKVCIYAEQSVIPGGLPQNRPFTPDAALSLMDAINSILAQAIYHTDVRLQLESVLLRTLKEMD